VFKNGAFEAAIGMSVPIEELQGRKESEFTGPLKEAACAIDKKLLSIESIG